MGCSDVEIWAIRKTRIGVDVESSSQLGSKFIKCSSVSYVKLKTVSMVDQTL